VIEKILLIRESGILPFYVNQKEELEFDSQLLSGFCMAVNNVAKELSDYLDVIMMKNNYIDLDLKSYLKICIEDSSNRGTNVWYMWLYS